MADYLVPVTLHHTILVPYELDPYDGAGLEQALAFAKDDPDLHEHFPANPGPGATADGWWDVETDPDDVLTLYQACRDGNEALARGLMALMMQ